MSPPAKGLENFDAADEAAVAKGWAAGQQESAKAMPAWMKTKLDQKKKEESKVIGKESKKMKRRAAQCSS